MEDHQAPVADKPARRPPWNKGKLVGQKAPLKLKDIWAIRIHLQLDQRVWELALFNPAVDSKLRGCDLVNLRVRDFVHPAKSDGRSKKDSAPGAV